MSAHSDEEKHATSTTLTETVGVQAGVLKMDATLRYLSTSRWALYVSIALASYIYSLDGSTTYTYL